MTQYVISKGRKFRVHFIAVSTDGTTTKAWSELCEFKPNGAAIFPGERRLAVYKSKAGKHFVVYPFPTGERKRVYIFA